MRSSTKSTERSDARWRSGSATEASTSTTSRPVDSLALGAAVGVAWGLAVGVLGLASKTGWGDRWRHLLADVYVGFEPGSGRASIGVAWAVVDGFLGGTVIGWLYNRFARD